MDQRIRAMTPGATPGSGPAWFFGGGIGAPAKENKYPADTA
jgi:hypothetical protein